MNSPRPPRYTHVYFTDEECEALKKFVAFMLKSGLDKKVPPELEPYVNDAAALVGRITLAREAQASARGKL